MGVQQEVLGFGRSGLKYCGRLTTAAFKYHVTLSANDYILNAQIFNIDDGLYPWKIDIICLDWNSTDPYIVSTEYIEASNSWIHAQLQCLTNFGTTLATIKTQQDIEAARKIVLEKIGEESVNLYIGLYKHTSSDGQWQWIDGNNDDILVTQG